MAVRPGGGGARPHRSAGPPIARRGPPSLGGAPHRSAGPPIARRGPPSLGGAPHRSAGVCDPRQGGPPGPRPGGSSKPVCRATARSCPTCAFRRGSVTPARGGPPGPRPGGSSKPVCRATARSCPTCASRPLHRPAGAAPFLLRKPRPEGGPPRVYGNRVNSTASAPVPITGRRSPLTGSYSPTIRRSGGSPGVSGGSCRVRESATTSPGSHHTVG